MPTEQRHYHAIDVAEITSIPEGVIYWLIEAGLIKAKFPHAADPWIAMSELARLVEIANLPLAQEQRVYCSLKL